MGTGTVCAERIAGGFVSIPAAEILRAWRACQGQPPGIGGFRAWLALREMVARRGGSAIDRRPSYDLPELALLLGVGERTAAASVRRLVAAGLVAWSPGRIDFAGSGPIDPTLEDTIGRGCGAVAIPRRLLRWLARGARPALVAVALGALLRCVSRRRAGWTSWGRMAASWVAGAFGVDVRRVKQARAELVALGWLAPAESPAWTVNRWGSAWTVDLGWTAPPRGDCHPGAADPGASLPPPCLDPAPPPGNLNPEPAGRGPAGARVEPGGKPTLRDVRPEDLASTARTLALHGQAAAAGRITAGEADRLRFVAAAEHARAVGRRNPCGLFARIVTRGWWHLLTQGDEDRARRRLRDHDRPAPVVAAPSHPGRSAPSAPPAPGPFRSPYGAERPAREPSALADLLARIGGRP